LEYESSAPELLELDILSTDEIRMFHSFKSNKRKLEYYFTRFLWKQFEIGLPIQYTKSGKPIISEGHISISHSGSSILIGYSKNREIGLDIEHFNPKIALIRHKFLSKNEISSYDTTNLKVLTSIWSIKEAVYKMLDISGLSFKEEIDIQSLGDSNRVFVKAKGNVFTLEFSNLLFEQFVISYCYKNKSEC
jgi:phosphopantetheinyl transferase (holo-ACP synthase)